MLIKRIFDIKGPVGFVPNGWNWNYSEDLWNNNLIVTHEFIEKFNAKYIQVPVYDCNLNLPQDVIHCKSPNEALKRSRVLCLEHKIENIWIIGGAAIYQQFIKRADRMFLTTIDKECEGDTYFPSFKSELWQLKNVTEYNDPEGYMLDNPNQLGLNYKIEEYEREF